MIRAAASILALTVCGAAPGMAASASAVAAPSGAAIFARCKVCHSVAAGAPSTVGPNLHGLFGRKAASLAGFSYSPAMRKSGVIWNDGTLARFLADPQGFIPGNRMGFPGIKDRQTLANLLAALKQATR